MPKDPPNFKLPEFKIGELVCLCLDDRNVYGCIESITLYNPKRPGGRGVYMYMMTGHRHEVGASQLVSMHEINAIQDFKLT